MTELEQKWAAEKAEAKLKRKQERNDRREARRELLTKAYRAVNRRCGLFMTPAQVKANAKVLVDKYIAGEIS